MFNIAPKTLLTVAMAAAALVLLVVLADLILAIPFGRAMAMDIMFLVSAALVLYLAYDSYREIA